MEAPRSAAIEGSMLPSDSITRVMEMCRMRRERQTAEQQVWEQDNRLRFEQERYIHELSAGLEEDEMAARGALSKAQERAWARVVELSNSGKHGLDTTGSDACSRRRNLERQYKKATFRAFWKQHDAPTSASARTASDVQARRDAVMVLRQAYAHSSPQFAANPEDLWRRGVVVAPDAQVPPEHGHSGEQIHVPIPAYHEFALRMRSQYERERRQRLND